MAVICQIVPGANLEPHQLQQLGEDLAQWCRCESGKRTDVVVELEGRGLADLRSGKYPRPLAERIAEATGYDLVAVRNYLGPEHSASQTVEIRVHCDDRQGIVDSLREQLGAELVQDVLVGGASWNE